MEFPAIATTMFKEGNSFFFGLIFILHFNFNVSFFVFFLFSFFCVSEFGEDFLLHDLSKGKKIGTGNFG